MKHFKKIYLYIPVVTLSVFFYALCGASDSNGSLKPIVTILFAGDTMIGRLVNEILQKKPVEYIWGNILPQLIQADLRIINLETTLTKSSQALPKVFNFKSDPKNVAVLKKANIDVVSLANNHSKDFNTQGLFETIKTLNNAHIKFIGAGKNQKEARKPIIVVKNNIKIGIIGATDNEPTWAATQNTPGVYFFNINNPDQLLYDIQQLKKRVDIVIVSLHWGPNMRQKPTQPYIDAAHAMINAGADIIHGHSAHVFQGIEIYKKKVILYDTGDLIDDYQIDYTLRNDRSFLFLVTATKDAILSVQLTPIIIKNMQVFLAENQGKKETIQQMQQLSREMGTSISNEGLITL